MHESSIEFSSYQSELRRLQSFSDSNWRLLSPLPTDLAKAGLFYRYRGDEVQCAFCYGIIKNWKPLDDPWTEHNVLFPNCYFVQENQSYFEEHRQVSSTGHHDYSRAEERLHSYKNWPNSRQDPVNLARAGFYYMGRGDLVKCFDCGCILKYWQEDDNPWNEHLKFFPECTFLKSSLGLNMIVGNRKDIENVHTSQRSTVVSTANKTKPASNNEASPTTSSSSKGVATSNESGFVGNGAAAEISRESPLVEAVIQMGYTKRDIEQAFNQRRMNQKPPFVSSRELLSFLMNGEYSRTQDVGNLPQKPQSSTFNEDRVLCKICMDNELSITFQPCGHFVCCSSCAAALHECPICRDPITDRIKTRMS